MLSVVGSPLPLFGKLRETSPLPSEPHSAWVKPKPADHTAVPPTPIRSRVSELQAKQQPTLVPPSLLRGVAASSVRGTTGAPLGAAPVAAELAVVALATVHRRRVLIHE